MPATPDEIGRANRPPLGEKFRTEPKLPFCLSHFLSGHFRQLPAGQTKMPRWIPPGRASDGIISSALLPLSPVGWVRAVLVFLHFHGLPYGILPCATQGNSTLCLLF